MTDYPTSLVTSEWVDYLQGKSREAQIAALATLHRRIIYEAGRDALSKFVHTGPQKKDKTEAAIVTHRAGWVLRCPRELDAIVCRAQDSDRMLVVVEQVDELYATPGPAYLLGGRIGLPGIQLGPPAVNVGRRRIAREQDAPSRVLPEPVYCL